MTVGNANDAAKAVKQFGAPAALKLIAPEALHKTEIGGVVLNVGPREAQNAYERLASLLPGSGPAGYRVLVTPMIRDGAELVCGAFRDPQFGPVVMAGLGGIHVELLRDVSFRLAPLELSDARKMLTELKAARLFEGYRGAAPLAREAMADLLVKLSELISDRAEIREIDLNPVFVDEKQVSIADVRIMLS
jgi:acyl-CoA synthetase (NDP forming)